MEPEMSEFLKRIASSIGIVLFWMGFNSTFGIMLGYGVVNEKFTWANGLVYVGFLGSFLFVAVYLKRSWDKQEKFWKEDHPTD